MTLPIAIDGLGGDKAPFSVVEGMSLALVRLPQLSFCLFGDEAMLMPLLKKDKKLARVTSIVHAPERVEATTKPGEALRIRKSSMRLAIESVKKGQCAAVVSGGNTGAYLALAKMVLKTLQGISRPAIVSQVPHARGESVFLDLGGNVSCNARNLVEFALMGYCFAKHVLFRHHPRVGLLNVGSELLKGPKVLQETSDILREILPHFHGFVEGNDITKGTVDVVVTDGFSGNVALKMGEGVLDFFVSSLRTAFRSSWCARLGYWMAKPALKGVFAQLDPRRYNGAFWLGVDGVAVKSHGGTDALGFSHAIETAFDISKSRLNEKIKEEMAALESHHVFQKMRRAS